LTIGGNTSKTPAKGKVIPFRPRGQNRVTNIIDEQPEIFSFEWVCRFLGYDLLIGSKEENPGWSKEGGSKDVQSD
jgi:hypothetical protein